MITFAPRRPASGGGLPRRAILDSAETDAYSGRARRTTRIRGREPAGGLYGMTGPRDASVAGIVLVVMLVLGCAPASAPAAPPASPVLQPAASNPGAPPAASAPSAAPAVQAPLQRVTMGVNNALSDAPLFIAEDRGYFRDAGLEIGMEVFQGGAAMVAPLSAGQLDVGAGVLSTGLYNAIARGVPVRVVADRSRENGTGAVIVRKDLYD